MAQPFAGQGRVWFYDTRTPARRMAVSTHPDAGVVVVSLWNGEACTGTFRLPIADAARFIAVLADSLAAGLAPKATSAPPPTLFARLARRLGWNVSRKPRLRLLK